MKKIWATLGPSSLKPETIRAMSTYVNMFRLNLSHVKDLERDISTIIQATQIPICLDTDSGKYNGTEVVNENQNTYGLTEKDIEAIEIGKRYHQVQSVALSFSSRPSQIRELNDVCGNHYTCIVAKIENKAGLANIEGISKLVDAMLIDRGDLSRQVDIAEIPIIQEDVLREYVGVLVATNMMDTLSATGVPSNGEANDVFQTIRRGADGIVLAGETAIGSHPIECVAMVRRIMDNAEKLESKRL